MRKTTFTITVPHVFSPISALSKESNSYIIALRLSIYKTIQLNPLNLLNFKIYHYFLRILIISFVFLLIQPLFAEQIKNCPQCDSNYSDKYSYCPVDGDILILKSIDAKEIEGFQNYKWDISVDEARKLGKGLVFEVDNSKPGIIVLNSNNFEFQEKQSLLKLEFYNDKLYKASVHFVTEANQASVNDHFSRAELIEDIYGSTRKIVFGWESNEEDSTLTSVNINELTYQHKWKTVLGDLNYQIGSGGYGKFLHSFFYSSKDADQIDNEKLKSVF